VTGNNATHSDLPDNPEVIQYVAEKILKNESKRKDIFKTFIN
ncbi:alpha/beta hydrolase, partial [Streptococcus agalactiae]|nr:alpha/beta hydrolase [Streptococcus agalactiae]